mmetsp:Transcript_15667/g.44941  ORF Transcript_15667/g.44941 Transcript_15667/m.44941 type:complete len:245 (-) Transcript_15667:144-878(-)
MVSAAMEHMDRSLLLLDLGGRAAAEKPKGPRGVRFSRNITHIEQGSHMSMLMSTNQNTWADDDPDALGCMGHDKWGDNQCRFEYGSNLKFKVSAKIGKPVKAGSKIVIDVPKPHFGKGSMAMAAAFIGRIKPMHMECPACTSEGKCTVEYMDNKIELKIPPCPIPAGETVFVDKTFPLPQVPGLNSAEGSMLVNMTATREDGSVLGQVSLKFGMGSLESVDGPADEGEEQSSGGLFKHKHKHKH